MIGGSPREPSEHAEGSGGCHFCLHYDGRGHCTAFPTRMPLPIFGGDIDHMIVRPRHIGDDVFEPIDFEARMTTGERRPAAHEAETSRR